MSLLDRLYPYRQALILGFHVALISMAYVGAYALRFDFRIPPEELARCAGTLPYLIALRLFVFERFGLFRGYWRHVGLRDVRDLGAAVSLSSALFLAALFVFGDLRGLPRSILPLDWLLAGSLVGGSRFIARYLRERESRRVPGRRTFIIGAGEAGEQFLRQVLHDPHGPMRIVGLIDDDPQTHGRTLHGVRVLGETAALGDLVERHRVGLLVIAIPSAGSDRMQRIVERCGRTGVEFKILPSLPDLLEGRAGIAQLRSVELQDLLRREPPMLNSGSVPQEVAGRAVLITGAAGSIGAELARQIAPCGPARLVLLDRAESPLYLVNHDLARAHPELQVVPVLANIMNPRRLEESFRAHQPDYVFHTAGYKHGPLLEPSLIEAAWNNVFGTLRVAQTAARQGVGTFVLISTDKAVNPTTMMGLTKRIAERIVLELPALRTSGTDFRAVRFGNALSSEGGVIPLFKRQLAAGGPLTVTHPDMQRQFATIPEAVHVLLQAAALQEAAGRVAILEMGTPVRILELAEQLIRLAGLEPYRDVDIVFTGLRAGEKLTEELVAVGEIAVPTALDRIRLVERTDSDGEGVERGLARLAAALTRANVKAVKRELAALVPEYRPPVEAPATPAPSVAGTSRLRLLRDGSSP